MAADTIDAGRRVPLTAGSRLAAMTPDEGRSPRVERDGWGFVEVERIGRLRDAKLWPGGGRAWDWNETGTHHRPGILPADLAELLEHGPDVVVLSRGRELRLETSPEAAALLEAQGVETVRAETGAAIEAYNRLAGEGRRVAALLHSTC
jgi:hypothetical protein